MKAKNRVQLQEDVLVENILALLEDFHEHAREIADAQRELEAAPIESIGFHGALASLTVWLGGLKTLVPGILSEIQALEDLLDKEDE